jgi:hypothetical protein
MHFLITPWVPPSGACYRTDFLRRRPFDESYLDADVLIAYLAMLDGEDVLMTCEPLVRKLDHADSASGQSRRTAIYHYTYAQTYRIVTEHPAWPGVHAELRAVLRRYPTYQQASLLKFLATAGRGQLVRDLIPYASKPTFATRVGLHAISALVLGEFYWDLLPSYVTVKNVLRAAVRGGRGRRTGTTPAPPAGTKGPSA